MFATMKVALMLAALVARASACSNLLVSASASYNGTIVAYNADSTTLYGSLGIYPAADHAPGTMREVWDWDSSEFLGVIPEAPHTYNVVGNINEHGLIIAETTFGGLPALDGHGHGHLVDYGSLIWITLQRARTAREAIALMDSLCTQYGYASDGESFAIADQHEVWLMEVMSKAEEKGVVWVASRVPEGYITATANQARTLKINFSDPDNVLYAKDVVTFAQKRGLYPANASAADFSFSDVYDPIVWTSTRFSVTRVWSLLNPLSNNSLDSYIDFVKGENLTHRLPLMVQAGRRLSVEDVMTAMRTHNQGTYFDNTGLLTPDVGAESGHTPYRTRPLVWTYDSKHYVNERTVATQQSAWAFVAHSRVEMPDPIAALLWFAPDDSGTSARIPVYACITRLPPAFADRYGQVPGAGVPYGSTADAYRMTLDSAFWIWNLVGNMFQGHHNQQLLPMLDEALTRYQRELQDETAAVDALFPKLYAQSPEAAAEYATQFVVNTGQYMAHEWLQFWMTLFSTIRDGGILSAPALPVCAPGETTGCTARPIPSIKEAGYDQPWYGRIVTENGDHYRMPATAAREAADPAMQALLARKLQVFSGKQRRQ